ncbi:GNAT family protein [Streptomyces sp. 71268]|uniref:GNAT family N-acetyltransferase n=1 Tax=Streptomyces sp. 71268 TaxID=3002640 RepID=UPI0023F821CD|nr:GNAT family protein [Streptomyces sp. 71268]WEV27342.1 GNAT family protein [Streptomyces sp. 71268]
MSRRAAWDRERGHERAHERTRERGHGTSETDPNGAGHRAAAPVRDGAPGTAPPARAADPHHEAVPDVSWALPVPEQPAAHRGARGPGEPRPPGERAVVVESSRFRLRELAPTDVDAVLAVFGDPGPPRAYGTSPFRRRDAVALVEQALASARRRPRTHYRLAVSRADSGELIGTAKLVLDRPARDALVRTGYRSAEVGMALRADQASVGHSMEVGYLLGVLGFDRLGLHRLWAGVLPSDTTAQRAAEKAGMTREGVLRHCVYANGGWHDTVQYAILEHDWHARLRR